ncbi:sensor histidine kinase [Nocardioides acrostichi]|uniref:Histidine kinase/HSP90-like ATPase domain-containing protein n=1 Tax=Nocardioides acrostichi TaxID=2784339 RepID=A0A930UYF9_9ACTN|nr:histidine kinase [Nocardioides acrostichi]MBF4160561.1 hypothetical protein [Nocardioides acrostichi]
MATSLELRKPESARRLVLIEAASVGLVCGSVAAFPAIFGATVTAPFVGGLRRGTRGVFLALAAGLSTSVLSAVVVLGTLSQESGQALLTWTLLGLGLGLVSASIRHTLHADDAVAPYRHAAALLRELVGITDSLSSGLDQRNLGGQILSEVRDELPTVCGAVYVPHDDGLIPLAVKSFGDDHADACALAAERAWSTGQMVAAEGRFAFCLTSGSRAVAVVSGVFSERFDPQTLDLARVEGRLRTRLGDHATRLETALLFDAFRGAATADERQRLSREMHDGVAQDIAALGYLVDALAAAPVSEAQAQQLDLLRQRVTGIVADVRRTVMTLRTSVGESESLGSAITALTRNLAQVSGVAIEVTLDEHAQRLRPEIEAELFRITQEAVNNAVKHSGCTGIRVHCQVHAPDAVITVQDDGRGLGSARDDSYGMRIMAERARLVGAELQVLEPAEGGLAVQVRLGRAVPDDQTLAWPHESSAQKVARATRAVR